ncbi:Hypothetical_protein [Hexamita inflata]|uniref:Hypothetical_protein n=1 Tax=Hexamita inflata TaxID=28002 RepID=A0ABP1GSK0_9EUKA
MLINNSFIQYQRGQRNIKRRNVHCYYKSKQIALVRIKSTFQRIYQLIAYERSCFDFNEAFTNILFNYVYKLRDPTNINFITNFVKMTIVIDQIVLALQQTQSYQYIQQLLNQSYTIFYFQQSIVAFQVKIFSVYIFISDSTLILKLVNTYRTINRCFQLGWYLQVQRWLHYRRQRIFSHYCYFHTRFLQHKIQLYNIV